MAFARQAVYFMPSRLELLYEGICDDVNPEGICGNILKEDYLETLQSMVIWMYSNCGIDYAGLDSVYNSSQSACNPVSLTYAHNSTISIFCLVICK